MDGLFRLSLVVFRVLQLSPEALALQAHVLGGQMGTDRARCIRMPQFGQRRQILLAPAQRGETRCFCCVFFFLSWYISLSIRRRVSVKAYQTLSENTDTENTRTEKGRLSPLAVLL